MTKMVSLFVMLLSSFAIAQGKEPAKRSLAVIPAVRDPFYLSMKEVEALPKSPTVHVIDVREVAEHEALRVKSKHGVWFYPLTELQKKKGYAELIKEIPKTELIVFVCANGARAKLARDYMATLGYQAKFASLYKF